MLSLTEAVKRGHALVKKERKPYIIYRRNGKIAVISLQSYLDAGLDDKGAKRICVCTENAFGKPI